MRCNKSSTIKKYVAKYHLKHLKFIKERERERGREREREREREKDILGRKSEAVRVSGSALGIIGV